MKKVRIENKWYIVNIGKNDMLGGLEVVELIPCGDGDSAIAFNFENNYHYEKGGKIYRKAVDRAFQIARELGMKIYSTSDII